MPAVLHGMLGSLEWDFATKVTVAAIGALGVIIAAWINARRNRSVSSEIPDSMRMTKTLPQVPARAENPASPVAIKPLRGTPIPFSHSEISAHIKRGTPYQQSQLEHDYIGATIRWRGILRSIDRSPNGTASVVVDCADDQSHVSCQGLEADIADLVQAEEGAMVEVVGVIECVSSAYTELSDCLIRRVEAEVSK